LDEPTVESKNKDAISRVVMAGMRLYGYQQRKKTNRSRRRSASPSIRDAEAEQESEEAAKDEEYKLVYHQTHRGAVFAFRSSIASTSLHTQPNKIRDTVDRLLAIFCTDPLAAPEVASQVLGSH